MIHILVTTHGKLAEGLIDSATMLVGEQEAVEYISFEEGMGMDELEQKYEQILKDASGEEPYLVFCDIMGGTPFNIVSKFSFKNDAVEVIYGVNLPVLIEAMTSREGMDFPSFARELGLNGKESIGFSEL